VFTHPPQAPLGLVLAQLGRVLAAASLSNVPRYAASSPDDPVFLPDFAALTPDQAQELRYGKRRRDR
jgi:hypothetical protein